MYWCGKRPIRAQRDIAMDDDPQAKTGSLGECGPYVHVSPCDLLAYLVDRVLQAVTTRYHDSIPLAAAGRGRQLGANAQ